MTDAATRYEDAFKRHSLETHVRMNELSIKTGLRKTPMTLQDQIKELLARAAPMREFDHDDPRAARLPGIVDEINKLRAQQEKEAHERWKEGYVAEHPPVADDTGNASTEGGDALPSREELEEAAAKAGIAFRPNISDRKLAERIEAHEAQEREDMRNGGDR